VRNELVKVGQKAKIPGFRPGKIPMDVLQKRYGTSIMGEVIERAVNDATRDVVKEHGLVPALRPDVNITNFDEGKDLEFSISLEVMPQAPEVDYKAIKLEKLVIEVSDEEVNSSLERIAANNGDLKEKSGKAAKGDVVNMDFKGFIGDEAFAGGEGKGFDLELGSNQFIPGFEEQLIGAKAGDDVTVTVSFPKDYHSAELAGKESRFECTIHKVQERTAPEMNDAFASKLGVESLEKLKELIRGQLAGDFESLVRNRIKKKLFDVLDEQTSFDVPEGMVKLEFDAIWKQFEQAKARGQVDEEGASEEELKKEYEAIAKRRVRMGILLSQVAGSQKMEVTTEELRKAIFEQARMYPGQERQIFEFYNKHPEHVNELRGPILEEKAVDYVLSQVQLTEKKVSTADIVKMDEEEDAAEGAKPKKKAAAKKADKAEAASDDADAAPKKAAKKKAAAE
jgi:trigger factor